jgi:ABC-type transport system involved in multi-copper enzyme maturation permease subunit
MLLELRVQRSEPLTALYLLVLGLLAMAFAASGPVELVRNRGAVPRDAAWSLMLASTAITAFGQVITTMVAATVVLRDRADRVADLLVTTRLTDAEYRVGKLLAALLMLALIYAAIPLGLVAGALVGGGSLGSALAGSLPPFVLVVVPTMLAVGALQFAAGVLSGRLWVIVGQGLVLIWLWTAAIDAAARGGGALTSVLDPFGSAPLLAATAMWTDAERAVRPMPVTAALAWSRVVWLLLGAGAAWLALGHRPGRRGGAVGDASPGGAAAASVSPAAALRRAAEPRWWVGFAGTAHYVVRWMLRDPGWRVLTVLGAVNVGVHAATAGRDGSADSVALDTLQEHARLFLILLATIYAGELVWREREERSAPFFDGLPASRGAIVAGRIVGVIMAQGLVVLLLLLAAGGGVTVATGVVPVALPWMAAGGVMLPFVTWMLVSLAVHVLIQHKVMGHLVCIAGWAVASVRFGAVRAGGDGRVPAVGWLAACLLAVCIVRALWRGDAPGRGRERRAGASTSLR